MAEDDLEEQDDEKLKLTFAANLTLEALNKLVEDTEKIGWVLTAIAATSADLKDFNAAEFDSKIPNNGPYSRMVRKGVLASGKVFSAVVFENGKKIDVDVVR
jgi:hypothetical protein